MKPGPVRTRELAGAATGFIENRGQFDKRVRFQLTDRGGQTLWLTAHGSVFDTARPKVANTAKGGARNRGAHPSAAALKFGTAVTPRDFDRLVFSEEFRGAHRTPRIEGIDPLPGISNYFVGNDPKAWRTDVRSYREVVYRDVWDGIDFQLYLNGPDIEQEFVVKPGADLSQIHVAFKGIKSLKLAGDGSLVVRTAFGELREMRPHIYEQIAGKRVPVEGRFKLTGKTAYTFEVASHRAQYALVIDPTLLYSTYLGGSEGGSGFGPTAFETGNSIAADSQGNAYVAGVTGSVDFPVTGGAFQMTKPSWQVAFITKFGPTGQVVYSTYLGSALGSAGISAWGIAVDAAGEAYVTGVTPGGNNDFTTFPTTANAFAQQCFSYQSPVGFLTKLNAAGDGLEYSTCLGSPVVLPNALALDSSGRAYIVGSTGGGLPTTSAAFQQNPPSGISPYNCEYYGVCAAFLSVIDPSLSGTSSLVYSTYLAAGDEGSPTTQANSVAVDSFGMAYLTGRTTSANFPVTPGAFLTTYPAGCTNCGTAFVAKLNPQASGASSLVYATYLGGTADAFGVGIAVDSSGNAYVTGPTNWSRNGGGPPNAFPTRPGAFDTADTTSTAFLTKLNAAGSGLAYSTLLGSPVATSALAINATGDAYVTGPSGFGGGRGVTVTPDAFQSSASNGDATAFVMKLDSEGRSVAYGSYLGGSSFNFGKAIAVDATGDAYLTGWTASPDFPVTSRAFQPLLNPGRCEAGNGPPPCQEWVSAFAEDAFVTKFPIGSPQGLSIAGILPAAGGNAGQVTAEIVGSGFHNGVVVSLGKIVGVGTSVGPGGRKIEATFDLQGATPGPRDLVVTNPDGSTATLPAAFTVQQGGSPQVWVDVVGPSVFRVGSVQTFQTYGVVYGNTGNVDAGPTAISVSFPPFMNGTLAAAPGPVTADVTDEGDPVLTAIASSVPAGSSNFATLQLALPNPQSVQPHQTFSITAWADPTPYSSPPAMAAPPSTASDALLLCLVDTFCLNLYEGSRECSLRETLATYGVSVVGCPCPPGCVDLCTQQVSSRPAMCTSGCTDVARLNQYAFNQLLAFDALLPDTCPLTITGAGESDNHRNGPCSHCKGYSVDLDPGPANCLTTFIKPSGRYTSSGTTTIDGCPVGIWKDLANNITFLDETTCQNHWHLKFRDHGPTCDDSGLLTGQFNLPGDPNDKAGSVGAGPQQYLSAQQPLRYSIFFENVATATAPAQQVVITDPLDTTSTDLTTLSLGPIIFGNTTITPPPGLTHYSTSVDFRPTQNLIVAVDASLDQTTGLLTWKFASLDGTTGLPTTNPSAGFLPPNTNPPQGQGSVFFTVMPKQGVPTNTQIQNQATVVFDALAPISTAVWSNSIDNTNPVSQVLALPTTEMLPSFQVQWSGTDMGSGVKDFTIYVSDNGGPFTVWLQNTTDTSGAYNGTGGHTYGFFSQARDPVGNVEPLKAQADTTTSVAIVPHAVSGHVRYYGSGSPMAAVEVDLSGASSQVMNTDASGVFSFTGLGDTDWTLTPQSQTGVGTAISVLDAVYALQAAVGLRQLNAQQTVACDTSGNGLVTPLDAVYILQYAVGLIQNFPATQPCGSLWAFVPAPASTVMNEQLISPAIAQGTCQHGAMVFPQLMGDADNQDFAAVVVGDCTGNWHTATGTAVPAEVPSAAQVRFARPYRGRGGRVRFPLLVESGEAFQALDSRISYDPARLQLVGVRPMNAASNALLQYNANVPGEVRIALAGAEPIVSTNGPVLALDFEPRRSGRLPPPHVLSASVTGRSAAAIVGD